MVKYIAKYWVIVASMMLVFVSSCTKDYPKNMDSPDEVVLKSIKIVNAGAAGNTVVEGTIDEDKKTVSFPRLSTETDFSQIRFEAEMSNGAKLDQPSYAFNFAEGESAKSQVIKVVNNKRFREYMVTLRLLVPVFGADFGKPTIFDYTNNSLGNPIYPGFVSTLIRGTGFDGEHVLIVQRTSTVSKPHLLKVSDLKQNIISPIYLNMTGVAGGTFDVNVGAQVNGHTYIANLSSNSAGSPIKIYHWTDPTAAPQLITNFGAIAGAGTRYGDNMSVNLDENGNGSIYLGDQAISKIVRFTVTNYTTVSDPIVLPNATGSSVAMSFNQVGNSADYIYTGFDAPIRLASESAAISYSLSNTAVSMRGCDARVITFNDERYLIMTTAARYASDAVVLYVYDITKGSTTAEALQLFNERTDKSPVFQYSLLGPVNTAAITQTGWHVTKDADGKDDKLTLYSASTDAGFVIIDFPKKSLDD